jgi:hypothetical protein
VEWSAGAIKNLLYATTERPLVAMLVFQIAVLGDNLLLATLPPSEQLSNAGFAAQPLARQIPATLYLMRVDERMRIQVYFTVSG